MTNALFIGGHHCVLSCMNAYYSSLVKCYLWVVDLFICSLVRYQQITSSHKTFASNHNLFKIIELLVSERDTMRLSGCISRNVTNLADWPDIENNLKIQTYRLTTYYTFRFQLQ